MRKIQEIRQIIAKIPNVFYEIPPDEAERSYDPAVRTLWESDRSTHGDAATLNKAPVEIDDDEKHAGTGDIASPEEVFEYGAEIDESELVKALGGAKGDEIRKAVLMTKGTDALAWYVTFHARNVNPGIYIPISSILYLMVHVFGNLQTDFWTKFKLAFRALHQHELFHFATDYMAAQWECITSKPCKLPADKVLKQPLGYFELEEELANAQMLFSVRYAKRSFSVSGKSQALKGFVARQPEGYREALEYKDRKNFDENCFWLCRSYIENIPGFRNEHLDGIDLNNLLPTSPNLDWRYCPIHIVHDEKRFNLPVVWLDLPNFPRRR